MIRTIIDPFWCVRSEEIRKALNIFPEQEEITWVTKMHNTTVESHINFSLTKCYTGIVRRLKPTEIHQIY